MSDKPAWLRPHGRPWGRDAGKVVYDNPWIRLTEYAATAPTGQPARYGVVGFKNIAIAILPLHEDGTVTLVGQNRLPLADYSWEIPEGGGPLEEAPLAAARRELAEETGLAAAEWRQVLALQLSNSVTDERAIGFVALGLSTADGSHAADDTEDLAVVRAPFREVLETALAGHLQDALTVAMLLRGYHMAREGALPGSLSRAMLGY